MTLQTRDLVMVALGAEALLPELEDGVHLRWQMDIELGFPPYGFDLFRRPHQAATLVPIAAHARPDGAIPLGVTCRAVRLRLRWPGGPVEVTGRFAGKTMTSVSVNGANGAELVIDLAADALDEVVVLPGAVVLQALAGRVSQDALAGWGGALNGAHRIGFPVTAPAYAVAHAHSPDDWAEAADRLSRRVVANGPVTLPAALATRFGGSQFQALQGVLRQVSANGPSPFPVTASGAGSPRMQIDSSALLCLLASDPDFARILGLLRVDRSAGQGTRYDYKVVGYWSPGTTTSQVDCTGTVGNTPGTTVVPGAVLPLLPTATAPRTHTVLTHIHEAGPSAVDGSDSRSRVTIAAIPPNQVVDASSPWGHTKGIDLTGLKDAPLRLVFEREASGIVLHTTTPKDALQVTARDADGKELEVKIELETQGGRYTATHITGSGIVTIEVGGGPTTFFGVCVIVQTIIGDTREWICFDVKRSVPTVLEPPMGVTVAAVPRVDPDDSPLLSPASIRGQHGLAAALSWSLPPDSSSHLSRSPIAYHVYRKDLGDGVIAPVVTPDPSLAGYHRLTEDRSGTEIIPVPVKPARNPPARSRPTGWPVLPVHFVDATTTERWYSFAVKGVDLFGRTSAPTTIVAELRDLNPPPPPAGTRTQLVDGLLGPGDSDYRPELQAMIPTGADSVLLVDWEWPPTHYRLAPDAAEFRIYWQPSRLNALTGHITSVTDHGETSDATVTLDTGSLSSKMTDGWLRLGPDFFRIVGSTTGTTPLVTVKNLRITRTATGGPTPPGVGRCSISIGGGDGLGVSADPNFKDFRNPAQWGTRLVSVPLVQPVSGHMISVANHGLSGEVAAAGWHDNHDGTSSVSLGRRLCAADGVLRGGVFSLGIEQFAVLANSEGPGAIIVVQNSGAGVPPQAPSPLPGGAYTLTIGGLREVRTDIPASALGTGLPTLTIGGGTLVTPAGDFRVASVYTSGASGNLIFALYIDASIPITGSCTWFPGYQLVVTPAPALSVGMNATAAGAVGIACADGRAYVSDTRGDPARVGNEGSVCAPMIVTRQRHGPVALPSAPGSTLPPGQTHLYASKPDYFGRSFFTLRWTPGSGLSYLVYRALDDALFLRDREQRRKLTGHYGGRQPFDDDAGFSNWFSSYAPGSPGLTISQLTAAESTLTPAQKASVVAAWEVWAARFYPTLDDATLQVLANRTGNESAFVRLNVEPLTTAIFEDALDGHAPSRFFYRTRAIDVAGNQSDLSPSSLPVYVPIVLAPARPTLLEAAGGDGVVTLRWMQNLEADLDGYLLYRSENADDANDLRTMVLHRRVAREPTSVLRAGEVAPLVVHDGNGTVVSGRLEITDGSSSLKLPAKRNFYYRLVGINSAGVSSQPSSVIAGQAFQLPPGPPTLAQPTWGASHVTVDLTWSAIDLNLECQVERRVLGRQMWKVVSGWLARGVYSYQDAAVDGTLRYEYRIRVRDVYGQTNSSFQVQATQ